MSLAYIHSNLPRHDSASPARLELLVELQSQIGGRLSPSARRELSSLARESDAELLDQGLLSFASRQERANQDEVAMAVYRTLLGGSVGKLAQERLSALEGGGQIGDRAEVLLRNFVGEASNPSALIGMAGAQTVFHLGRFAFLSHLAASPVSWATRGFGARAVASTGAFLIEAPSFTAFTRGANAAFGHEQDWSLRALGLEVAAGYLTLGALRLSGGLSSAAYRRAAGLSPLAAHTPMQTAFGQIGMLGGIMIGHELETGVGLRERVDGATTLLDSLAMLLQFNVAGRIVHQGLGSRYAAWQRELHWRSEKLDPRPALDGPQGGATFGQPALALAGPAAFEAAKPKFDLKIFDRLLAKSSQDDFGQGSGGSNRRSPYRSGGGLRHFLADHQITAYKTVAFESNGNIREIELMQAQTLWHWEIPKGARLTQEKESGAGEWLVVVMPENGVLTVGNEKITGSNRFHFSAEGKLMAVELAEAAPGFFNEMKYELIGGRHQLIQGIFFFRGDKVYFDEGGRVDKAWFSVDKRYGGVLYPQGTTVSYDQAGKLSGILQKAPEKIGPKEATIDDLTPAELKDALSRGSRWEPVAVAEKLAKSGHSEGFSFLRERIQKPGLKRKLATFSDALLGSLVTKHSSFPLAELLFWDRERAAKALGRLGAKEDIDLFRAWLEGSNPDQRALAKTALAAHDEVSKSSSAGPTGIPSGEQ